MLDTAIEPDRDAPGAASFISTEAHAAAVN